MMTVAPSGDVSLVTGCSHHGHVAELIAHVGVVPAHGLVDVSAPTMTCDTQTHTGPIHVTILHSSYIELSINACCERVWCSSYIYDKVLVISFIKSSC